MRLNVKEAGADGIFLNRWKCSFGTQALFPMKYFRWKKKKKASEMLHYIRILLFLPTFFRKWGEADFERLCHVFPKSEVAGKQYF